MAIITVNPQKITKTNHCTVKTVVVTINKNTALYLSVEPECDNRRNGLLWCKTHGNIMYHEEAQELVQ